MTLFIFLIKKKQVSEKLYIIYYLFQTMSGSF